MVSWYRQWLSQLLAAFFLPGTQIGFWNYSSELANKISVLLHTKNDRACSNSVCNVVCQSLSCVWLWDHMDCSTPGFPVLHYLPESAKTHVQWVDDAIQPSCPLLPLPSIFPSIRVFSNEAAHCIRWPKYWSFNFSISPSNEYSGLISFRIVWFDLLAVQGTLKSLIQNHSSKASILWCSVFLMVQLWQRGFLLLSAKHPLCNWWEQHLCL